MVIINNDEIRIGCENHKTHEWKTFTDSRIKKMDGNAAMILCDAYAKGYRLVDELVFAEDRDRSVCSM